MSVLSDTWLICVLFQRVAWLPFFLFVFLKVKEAYMEFRKMVTITLYARQQKRHRCMEQSFGLWGEGEGGMIWENSIETCILSCETDRQSRFNAWDRVLRAGTLGWPRGMRWGGKKEGGSEWGTHVHPWLIHVNVWQKPPQYYKVISLQLK